MFVVNTSFHLLRSVEDRFIDWVKTVYAPAASSVSQPLFLKILADISPEMSAYCLQLTVDNLDEAIAWHDGEGASLRASLTEEFGEQVVFFTTSMQQLPLK